MNGHGEKLTRKQDAAIGALLSHPTISAAAQSVGLGEATLRRLLPNLRAVGIDITFYREAQSGRRLIAIGKGTDSIVTPVTPVTPVSGEGDANADRVTQGDVNPAFIVTQNRVYSDDGDDGDAKPTTLSKDVIEVE